MTCAFLRPLVPRRMRELPEIGDIMHKPQTRYEVLVHTCNAVLIPERHTAGSLGKLQYCGRGVWFQRHQTTQQRALAEVRRVLRRTSQHITRAVHVFRDHFISCGQPIPQKSAVLSTGAYCSTFTYAEHETETFFVAASHGIKFIAALRKFEAGRISGAHPQRKLVPSRLLFVQPKLVQTDSILPGISAPCFFDLPLRYIFTALFCVGLVCLQIT